MTYRHVASEKEKIWRHFVDGNSWRPWPLFLHFQSHSTWYFLCPHSVCSLMLSIQSKHTSFNQNHNQPTYFSFRTTNWTMLFLYNFHKCIVASWLWQLYVSLFFLHIDAEWGQLNGSHDSKNRSFTPKHAK